ncbi:flagellar biosynthetic protein FliR [Clostridia bacterium]|nr:flagellar biosynthetic protein FliR [Clostridia bacterium]
MQIRLGLALAMSYIIFASGHYNVPAYSPQTYEYIGLMMNEFFVGVVIGFSVYVVMTVFFFVGHIIDTQIGLAMMSVMDPLTQINVPITGNLLYLIILLLMTQTGGFHALVAAFIESFDIIPLGQSYIIQNEGLMNMMIDSIVDFFTIGVQIGMPVLGTILVLDVALGLLVKASPQMNIFSVGMPVKLIVGLLILLALTPMYSQVYDAAFNDAYRSIVNMTHVAAPEKIP